MPSLLPWQLTGRRIAEVAGTIAGDDTILVICRSAADAQALQNRLDRLMRGT